MHWSGPQSSGCSDERGDIVPETGGSAWLTPNNPANQWLDVFRHAKLKLVSMARLSGVGGVSPEGQL